jgi:Holliday junction resolvasome RuvABC endonuclease subunit
LAELNILKEKKINGSISLYEIEPPFPLPNRTKFGIDPGTKNAGLTILHPNQKSIQCFKIKMVRADKALHRMVEVQNVLTRCITWFGYEPLAIIEGATFGNYRQVELAEQRAAIALWFYRHDVDVETVPPKKIRKVSFGNGNIKNPWENIQDDIAASIGCAYYTPKASNMSSIGVSSKGK